MKINDLHSYILSNFSATAALEEICKIAQIEILSTNLLEHPDVISITPQINEKTVLQKPSIKIDQIRQLKNDFNRKPIILSNQLAIFWDAQHLTVAASNSLLKLLEEPSPNSLLFLIVNSSQNVLPTIISRCQIITATSQQQNENQRTEVTIDLKYLYQANISERIELLAQACPSQKETLIWLKSLVMIARKKLPFSSIKGMKSLGQLIENCQIIYNDICIYNINYKLALDMLAMHWDKKMLAI